MSEKLTVSCPSCGKSFQVPGASIGKRGRCNGCGNVFTLAVPENDDLPDLADLDEPVMQAPAHLRPDAAQSPSAVAVSRPSPPSSQDARKPFNWSETSLIYKIGGIAFVVLLVGALVAVKFYFGRPYSNRKLGEAIDRAFIKPDETPAPPPVSAPPPPPKPAVLAAPPTLKFQTRATYVEGIATVPSRQAKRTNVRLFLPPGTHADASLPCVFVAPAGSNLLTGVAFDESEHLDYLPLLARGVAVCLYTLDGTPPSKLSSANERANEMLLGLSMTAYAESDGGLKNLADAIDAVLASAKSIDPNRLGAAGHSSSGTIALMAAAKEPRIKAVAAFAPAIDLPERFKEHLDAFDGRTNKFLFSFSPSRIETLPASVFVYQCEDDDNTPADDAKAFAARHGPKVTLQLAAAGGHVGAFTSGTTSGFDFLARQFRATPIAIPTPAPAADNPAQRAAPAEAELPPPVGHLPQDRAAANDAPATTFSLQLQVAGGVTLNSRDAPVGFVLRKLDDCVEFVRPSDTGVAPRLRVYRFPEPPQVRGARTPKMLPDKGIIFVDLAQKVVHAHSRQNTTRVAFMTEGGTAMRTEGDDRDLGRTTREVLYSMGLGSENIVLHLIAAADEPDDMAHLETLAKGLYLADPQGRPIK